MTNNFKSPLAAEFDSFLQYKRALGYKYKSEETILHEIDCFICSQHICEKNLSKDLVMHWSEKKDHQTSKTHITKVGVMRQLGIYLNSIGISAYIYPLEFYSKNNSKFVPHIYTKEELKKFFAVVDNLDSCKISAKRHIVYPMLFRILLGCGLRLSETLNLKLANVDLNDGIITVLNGKFSKDRIVPMSADLIEYCKTYYDTMFLSGNSNDLFLPNRYNETYSIKSIYWSFRQILWLSGISHQGREKGPRIHDFRHTFAVYSLKQWVERGLDVNSMLSVLASYLGHSDISGTLGYLQLTVDMYPHITKLTEKDFGDIIPNGGHYYANH